MNRYHLKIVAVVMTLLVLAFPTFAIAAPTQQKSDPGLLIKQIMGHAYEFNQSINSDPYGIGDSLTDVEQDWGEADDKGTVAANYFDRNIRFLYDGSTPEQIITGIDDENTDQLQIIRLKKLKQTIGKPISEREIEGDYEVTYSPNDDCVVIFIFNSKFADPHQNPTLRAYTIRAK